MLRGNVVATMHGPSSVVGPGGVYSKDRFSAKLHRYDSLQWRHTPALLLLQGATVQEVLGTDWIVLDAQTLPCWNPSPGAHNVTVAQILENPGQLSPQHLFLEIRQALKL
jgi:hypothetical protein